MSKIISIVIPCFNEEENVRPIYETLIDLFSELPHDCEILFIDNASTDNTPKLLRELAGADDRVKVILNNRNFGIVRSPTHGMWEATGDAVIPMAADFQEPPDLIPEMIKKWEEGFKVVLAVRKGSKESRLMSVVRKQYYRIANRISEVPLIEQFNGYGLYDREVIDTIRAINDPYPYFRGLVTEVGYEFGEVFYTQPERRRGITKNNFYSLYDMAMNGLTSHSKVPLRLITLFGLASAVLSMIIAIVYLVYKLYYWDSFDVGIAPLVIGLFFFNSIILMILGLLGEYIGFINTRILNRPLVVEKERLNFHDDEQGR